MGEALDIVLGLAAVGGTLGGVLIGNLLSTKSQRALREEHEQRELARKKSSHLMGALSAVVVVCDCLENSWHRFESGYRTKVEECEKATSATLEIVDRIRKAQVFNTSSTDQDIFDRLIYEIEWWDQSRCPTSDPEEHWLFGPQSAGKTSQDYRYPQYREALENIIRAELFDQPRKIFDWDRTDS